MLRFSVYTCDDPKVFEEQLALIGRPGFQHITYIDDMLAPDVAPHIRNPDGKDKDSALFYGEMGGRGVGGAGLYECGHVHGCLCHLRVIEAVFQL
jgi:hypothetical protein